VPLGLGRLGDGKSMLGRSGRHQGRNQRVKASNTPSSMNDFPGDLILNQKEEGVKLDKNTIIESESMDRKKIFGGMWNMKNIAKTKILSRVMNY
jgi:hypothetical protein